MDPSTGAIKKKGSPYFYYPDPDDPEKSECSLTLKIKHVCDKCYDTVEKQIENREVFPLWKPKDCLECSYKGVKRDYALICSICSRLLNVCCRCLNEYSEYGPFKPVNLLLLYNKQKFDKFQLLKVEDKRRFIQYVFRKWKTYERHNANASTADAKANLKALREEIYQTLKDEVARIEAFKALFAA